MTQRTLIATLCVIGTLPTIAASGAMPPDGLAAPTNLRCEYLAEPLGLDVTSPRLSWEMVDGRRGAVQTAYQVLVADDLAQLNADQATLWDSGKVVSNQSIQVEYNGKPLASRTPVWWKVRVWDKDGQPSPWSKPAHWTMGLLEPADWHAKWIGDPTPPPPIKPANNGYHSELVDSPDTEKTITIDLGAADNIDAVKLYPARPYNWSRDEPGFMFPVRFRIQTATKADFADVKTVVDKTTADVAKPGTEPQIYSFAPTSARYVRLVVTRLRERNAGEYGLALAEFQVLAKDKNLAAGMTVTAGDSLERPEWSTRYLVDEDLTSHGTQGYDPLVPPMLRKTFAVADKADIKRAMIYVTALGMYELHINGARIGDHQLAPEWTDYHKRVQYQTYDVTDALRAGENAIGVQLADGWYAGRIGLSGIVPGGPPRAIYGRQPKLLLQLEIERADGQIERIATDKSWRVTTEGPLRVGDLLDGEIYDATREMPGWDQPNFADNEWQTAHVFASPNIELDAQRNEPVRVTQEITPIEITAPQPDTYVIDLGQNFAGWCRLKVRGQRGQTVTIRHAEVLNPDGTIYTDNLRSAQATDRYTLRGGDMETYEPRFTYHGFRYVELTGLAEPPTRETITGCAVHTDVPNAGEFECSDPLLNRLWLNIRWTQRANMHSVPTDCPQRDERLGWTGDILAFAQTACFGADMAAFDTKWLRDMRDAQTKDGRYPDFAPHPYDPEVRFSGVAAWGDAGVFVPWVHYVNYADKRVLAQHFESARRWVDWIHANNPDLLWKNQRHNDYGDWLNADTLKLEGWPAKGAQMPKEVFATAFFARSTQYVAQMAAAIGRNDDAARYTKLADGIKAAFNKAYVDADGRITGDTQAGYAIALQFNLLPKELQAPAAAHMVRCFEKYNGLISTGFHSTICLMNELTRMGYVDEAYRLIHNREMPSWGYAIDHGATTIWERWDGYVEGRGFQNAGMNSFAHYALGSVGEWMMRTIIGINPDPELPAYQHIILRPQPGGGLEWARGSYHSIHGEIDSEWQVDGERCTLKVRIPANTTATLYLKAAKPDEVRESGQPIADAPGVELLNKTDDELVLQLGAGSYEFETQLPN